MAAQDYTAVVQQLYVSYFGRPADYFGLQNFSAQLDAMGAPKTFAALQAAVGANGASPLAQLVNSFNNSAESVALYGNDNSQIGVSKFVAAIYQNVLGREADTAGFNFWVNAISSGTLSKANAAAAITAAASTNTSAQGMQDAITVANKLTVATTFTAALDTPTEFNAYAGDAAAATGRSLLQGVSNTTDVTAYQTSIDDAISTIVNVAVPGDTSALTVGVDTLVGTAGDDVFNAIPLNAAGAPTGTLGAFDSIDGGAGKDTLNIYADGTNNITQTGTVKNVETINIFNAAGGTAFGGAAVDASKFSGASAVWQIGRATDITNVGASTTAGFRAIAAADLSVTGSASIVSVALDNLSGAATTNVTALEVAGTKLTGVTLSGALVDNETYTGNDAASVALTATLAKDAQTFTLNTALNTTLVVNEGADTIATKQITTIAAAASTGNITFVGDADVATVTTGSGVDTVTLATAFSSTVKAASLNTGAGNDVVTVSAVAGGVTDGVVTVDAGAGNDQITVNLATGVKYNVTGGAGDDLITLVGTVKTGDVIEGGEGMDTIGLAGKAAYVADDYLVYTKVLKNFEAIKFSTIAGGTTALDASQVAAFKEFSFDAGGSITKVAADQSVSTAGNLTVQAAGYAAAASGAAASTTVYSTDTATGALKVEATSNATITAKAASIALTVTADDVATAAVLTGDVKTATVALANGVDANDAQTLATVSVTTATTAASGPYSSLGNLTSLTLTGNGSATVANATKLTSVDASGLASVNGDGEAAAGLKYTSTNTAAETIKLGAGIDVITLSASTYGGIGAAHAWDTVTGLNLVLNTAGTAINTAASDSLFIGTSAVTAAKFTSTETDIDLVLKAAAAANNTDTAHNTLVFAFGGDTYIMQDTVSNGLIDANDTVVKLTGLIDQDALILAINSTPVVV